MGRKSRSSKAEQPTRSSPGGGAGTRVRTASEPERAERREALVRPGESGTASQTLSPNVHVRALVELMRPAGIDLARRWVAALLLVPEHEREGVVLAVEKRIVEEFASDEDSTSAEESALAAAEARAMKAKPSRARKGVAGADGAARGGD